MINAIYNDGNETTEPESVPKGRSKGMSAFVKAVLLNSVSGALQYKGNSLVTKNGRTYGAPLPIATLPSIFRQHPTPMSNCSLDVINAAQRIIAEKDGLE